jgi:excisionase family DNA binding protein
MSLWTIKDVAAQLNISETGVGRLARTGQIPAKKIGKLWRFDPLKIQHWLDGLEKGEMKIMTKVARHLLGVVALALLMVSLPMMALAQQTQTPCEEVRSTLATSMADLATQVRTVDRENTALKAKVAELEKQLANHKEKPAVEKKP